MSSNRVKKRQLSTLNNIEPFNPPVKKQKTSIKSYESINRIFSNSIDHKQFIEYLQSIENSEIINLLCVPTIINTFIAQYSCGDIKQCANTQCSEEFCILRGEFKEYQANNDYLHKWFQNKYNVCWERNRLFCDKCSPYCRFFYCCELLQCTLELKPCDGYKNDKIPCMKQQSINHNNKFIIYKCGQSETGYMKCHPCENDFEEGGICDGCGRFFCDYYHKQVHFCSKCEISNCGQCQLENKCCSNPSY
eukprot:360853_1